MTSDEEIDGEQAVDIIADILADFPYEERKAIILTAMLKSERINNKES